MKRWREPPVLDPLVEDPESECKEAVGSKMDVRNVHLCVHTYISVHGKGQ